MKIENYISNDLLERFEFFSYNHALEIITQAFPEEWAEIEECLRKLNITVSDLKECSCTVRKQATENKR